MVRNATRLIISEYGRLADDLVRADDGFGLYVALLNEHRGSNESFFKMMHEKADQFLMVNNISRVMEKIGNEFGISIPIEGLQARGPLFWEWMIFASPFKVRLWNKVECSEQ